MPNPNDMMMRVDPNAPKPWDDPALRPAPAPTPAPAQPDTNPLLQKLLALIGMGGGAPPAQPAPPLSPTDPSEIIRQQMKLRENLAPYGSTGLPQ